MAKVYFADMCVQNRSWSYTEVEICICYPGSCAEQDLCPATHLIRSSEDTQI